MQGIKNAASNPASGYIKKEHSSMEEHSYYPLELYSLCFSNAIDRLFGKVILNQHSTAEVGFQTNHHNSSTVKGIW